MEGESVRERKGMVRRAEGGEREGEVEGREGNERGERGREGREKRE